MPTPVSSASMALPWLVNATEKFQEYGLINKGVLEVVGVDAPMIALARNPSERKEVTFRQTVILMAAFVLAPLHAWLFRNHYAKAAKLPKEMMRFSYEYLRSNRLLKRGLRQMLSSLKPDRRKSVLATLKQEGLLKNTGVLHKKILDAKTKMMTVDLMLEGLIFANLGFIKNAFGKLITGKKQFTGEMGVVNEKTLDAMYERYGNQQDASHPFRQKAKQFFQRWVSTGLAIVGTPLLAQAVKRSMYKRPVHMGPVDSVLKFLRGKARFFDYKEGLMLGLGPILFIGILNDVGDITAARSPHERREVFLKRLPVTVTFFFGDLIWMGLMAKLFSKRLGIPVTRWVSEAIKRAPVGKKLKAGKWASRFYLASFLLNVATVSAVIVANNRLTTKKVKEEANTLLAGKSVQTTEQTPAQQPQQVPNHPRSASTQRRQASTNNRALVTPPALSGPPIALIQNPYQTVYQGSFQNPYQTPFQNRDQWPAYIYPVSGPNQNAPSSY